MRAGESGSAKLMDIKTYAFLIDSARARAIPGGETARQTTPPTQGFTPSTVVLYLFPPVQAKPLGFGI